MGKVLWINKLNIRRRISANAPSLCHISPRSLVPQTSNYMKLHCSSGDAASSPTAGRKGSSNNLITNIGYYCGSVEIFNPKAGCLQPLANNQDRYNDDDECLYTPHPSSPTNYRGAEEGSINAQLLPADPSNDRPLMSTPATIKPQDKNQKKVVLMKKSRSRGIKKEAEQYYKQANSECKLTEEGACTSSGKNLRHKEHTSKDMISHHIADEHLPLNNISNMVRNKQSMQKAAAPPITVLDGPISSHYLDNCNSVTSDDNLFSSFERGRKSHSSNSSTDHMLVRYHGMLKEASARSLTVYQEVPPASGHTTAKKAANDLSMMSSSNNISSNNENNISSNYSHNESSNHGPHKNSISCAPLAGVQEDDLYPAPDQDLIHHSEAPLGATSWTQRAFLGQVMAGDHPSDSTPKHRNELRTQLMINREVDTNSEFESTPGRSNIALLQSSMMLMQRPHMTAEHRRRRKNWRSYSSRRGGAAKAALRRKAELQVRWQLTDKQVEWQSEDESSTASVTPKAFSSGTRHAALACKQSEVLAPVPSLPNSNTKINKSANRHALKLVIPKRAPSHSDHDHAHAEVNDETLRGPLISFNDNFSEINVEADLSARVPSTMNEISSESNVASRALTRASTMETSNYGEALGEPRSTVTEASVAVVKCSKDPFIDFKDSMVHMISERQIFNAPQLEELLQCFLSLNSSEHHDTIIRAFTHVWKQLFDQKSPLITPGSRSTFDPSPCLTPPPKIL